MSGRMRGSLLLSVPLGLAATAIVLQALDGRNILRDSELLGALAFIGFGIVGSIVLAAQPLHTLGRLFWVAGTVAGLAWASDEYARYSVRNELDLPGTVFAAWLQNWTWFLPVGLVFTLCLLLFPDGRLPSPRWRPVAWLAGTSLALVHIAFALHDEALDGFPTIPNPTGVLPDGFPLSGIAFGGVVLSALLALVSLVVRYRNSSGQARQQLKWVVYGVLVMAALNLGLPALGAGVAESTTDIVFGVSTLLFPLACGVAILRYRLYDIDLIVNRTLVYAVLTALLALFYLGTVIALQRLLEPVTADSDLAVAGSTLAVAALFRPARSRVQAFIDRRFYRRKYDAAETLGAFSARLRDHVDLDALGHELVTVVGTTMQPAHASLWLRPKESTS